MRATRSNLPKTKFSLHYTRRYNSYLAENTVRFHYNDQWVNAVCGCNGYFLYELYGTFK